MKKYITISFALVLISICKPISAQVTIGSGNKPVEGALLQLTEGATTTKGLGLPRVALEDTNALLPMLPPAQATDPSKMKEHTGIVVYNVNECLNIGYAGKGVFVWDGASWKKISEWTGGTVVGKSGKTYRTAKFGEAGEWMIENLAETEYDNGGSSILTLDYRTLSETNYALQYYYYPSDKSLTGNAVTDSEYYNKYKNSGVGLLYTWAAATDGANSDRYATPGKPSEPITKIQGLCPRGWHIPSDYDWGRLDKELAEHPYLYSSVTTPTAFDEVNTSTGYWRNPNNSTWYGEQGWAMKSSCGMPGSSIVTGGKSSPTNGFNILLIGLIRLNASTNNTFDFGNASFFWASTDQSDTIGFYRGYQASNGASGRGRSYSKANLHSIRCKKE